MALSEDISHKMSSVVWDWRFQLLFFVVSPFVTFLTIYFATVPNSLKVSTWAPSPFKSLK
jgi:hypothetical protein